MSMPEGVVVQEDETGEVVERIEEPREQVEARARELGWKPKDEYRGPPERWRDAPEFLKHGEDTLPILRERLRRQGTQINELSTNVKEMTTRLRESGEVLQELHKETLTAREKGYHQAAQELEGRMAAAVAEADVAGYERARQELANLNTEHAANKPVAREPAVPAKPAAQPDTPLDPIIVQWIQDNPWYDRDRSLNAYATDEHAAILRDHPGWSLDENLAEVKRRVVAKFPEKFRNPRRDNAPSVTQPRPSASKKSDGKTYDDMPKEAKEACDKFVRTIPGYTRETYVQKYFEDKE